MKKEIEDIIKKNLPEKKKNAHEYCIDSQDGCEECANGIFNQALSQINPSKIADEVLKVMVEKIEKEIEDIIKKNLPAKLGGHKDEDKRIYAGGFDDALSEINTSLIADEVLKVMVD